MTRTVGGPSRDNAIKNQAVCKNSIDYKPAAHPNWVDWCGPNAIALQDKITERLMGGTVANSSRTVYQGIFKKMAHSQGGIGKGTLSAHPGGR